MAERPGTTKRAWDHAVVGVLVSIALTIAIAVLGGFLLLEGDMSGGRRVVPEALRVPGMVLLLFSGILGAGIVAVSRSWAGRRGWPRAAKAALWSSAVAAALDAAFLVAMLYEVRQRLP